MSDKTTFYFAYGSNAHPDRFRSRVGLWRSRHAAGLRGYRLRFAASVQSESGGGAVIDEARDGTVDGVLYEITREQDGGDGPRGVRFVAQQGRERLSPDRDRIDGAGAPRSPNATSFGTTGRGLAPERTFGPLEAENTLWNFPWPMRG